MKGRPPLASIATVFPASMTLAGHATLHQRLVLFRARTRRVDVLRMQYREALADLDRTDPRRSCGGAEAGPRPGWVGPAVRE